MLFLYKNKDRDSNLSNRVFNISNCHVLCKDTTIKYKFRGSSTAAQYIQVSDFYCFQHSLDKIKACISIYGTDANLLGRKIVELGVKLKSKDLEKAAEDKKAMGASVARAQAESFEKSAITNQIK